MGGMIKGTEAAIQKIKDLPDDRQAYAAEVLEQIAAASGNGKLLGQSSPRSIVPPFSKDLSRPDVAISLPTRKSMRFSAAQLAPDRQSKATPAERHAAQLFGAAVTAPPVAVRPPSTTYCAPVMLLARSEHRNSTMLAISSAVP